MTPDELGIRDRVKALNVPLQKDWRMLQDLESEPLTREGFQAHLHWCCDELEALTRDHEPPDA